MYVSGYVTCPQISVFTAKIHLLKSKTQNFGVVKSSSIKAARATGKIYCCNKIIQILLTTRYAKAWDWKKMWFSNDPKYRVQWSNLRLGKVQENPRQLGQGLRKMWWLWLEDPCQLLVTLYTIQDLRHCPTGL